MHALAEELRRLRSKKEWSQEQVGMSIGLSQPQYSAYEHDTIPPLDRLQALAQLYDRPLKHFTDLLPESYKVRPPQNAAGKSASSNAAPLLENGSTELNPLPSDLREHVERLKGRFEQLSHDLNEFLRLMGEGGGGKSLKIR